MNRLVSYVGIVVLVLALLAPLTASAASDREREVRAAVEAFLSSRTAGMGWDVKVKKMTFDAPKLPAGAIDYEIVAPQQWEGWGSVNIAVIARQKERVVRNIPVKLEVEAAADMVVALHQIDSGKVVAAADVALQRREITQQNHLAARTVDEVAGKKARMALRANQPVRGDQLERVPLIKSGQMVTIVAENEVLKVTVSGKARGSGAEGDIIKVQNLNSLKEIPARVVNETTVQVAF